jgi:hypothetical protein
VQSVSGAGAARNVDTIVTGSGTGANVAVYKPTVGERVRITLQYTFADLTDGSDPVLGLAAVAFTQSVSGGLAQRTLLSSRLTTGAGDTSSNLGENNFNQVGVTGAPDYGGAFGNGASALRTGFHRWFRSGVGSNDTAIANGGPYTGTLGGPATDDLVFTKQGTGPSTTLNPFGTIVGVAGISAPGHAAGDWVGMYSFELQVNSLSEEITVNFFPPGVPGGTVGPPNFTYWRDSFNVPLDNASTTSFGSFASVRLLIPAPGVAGLLGIAGLLAVTRRR